MSKKLIKSVKSIFQEHFNTVPLCVFSPGRINLIGEHTDYNEGFAFPAAVNKGIVLAISKSDATQCTVYALDNAQKFDFKPENLKQIPQGNWRNYVLGVVAMLQDLGKNVGCFNAVFAGNIPSGAGMSSSAALENSFVYGLNELFHLKLSKSQMILVSQMAEHHFAGVKCGIMDQYASMFGVKNSALLLDCRTIMSVPYRIDFKSYKLMLINTNVKHDLAESAYNERRAVCEKVASLLKVDALRDAVSADLDRIKAILSSEDYHKALYVINENERVKQFAMAIQRYDMAAMGALLYQSHAGLSNNYKVSCPELDFLVHQTLQNPNILGARMMGGGFGGCTINLVKKTAFKIFKKQIKEQFKNEFNTACAVYSVKLSQGTRVV
jgi:galactokinase